MKRIISILLSVSILFSCSVFAFAESEDTCDCGITPVIYVPGFGEAIYMDHESDSRISIFPPEGNAILKCIPQFLKAFVALLITHNYDNFGDAAIDIIDELFGPSSCNFDGTPMYENTGIKPYKLPTDSERHKTANYEFRGSDDEPVGEYTFLYDSRLDPFYNAELLKEFVDYIKELTGHNTVTLACHSQGATVLATYLHLYGSDNIEKLVFMSPAYQGLSIMGALFSHEISLVDKTEEFRLFLSYILGNGTAGKILNPIISILIKAGVIESVLKNAETALFDQLEKVTEKAIAPTFGSMPGIWSFVPDEYYETSKEKVFVNDKRYEPLIEKLDNYHYNVKLRISEIITKAKDNGCSVIITVGYGITSAPITESHAMQSDALIETKYASLGANCADFSTDLGNNYVQNKTDCGHNHISSDNIIDASVCAFPEYTWFIKNQEHNDYNGDIHEFINWAILYDGQPTVSSNKDYPQFMSYNTETERLSSELN